MSWDEWHASCNMGDVLLVPCSQGLKHWMLGLDGQLADLARYLKPATARRQSA